MSEPKKIEGAAVVTGLPASTTPWQTTPFRGSLIAVSETEGAYIIRNGRAEKITLRAAE